MCFCMMARSIIPAAPFVTQIRRKQKNDRLFCLTLFALPTHFSYRFYSERDLERWISGEKAELNSELRASKTMRRGASSPSLSLFLFLTLYFFFSLSHQIFFLLLSCFSNPCAIMPISFCATNSFALGLLQRTRVCACACVCVRATMDRKTWLRADGWKLTCAAVRERWLQITWKWLQRSIDSSDF